MSNKVEELKTETEVLNDEYNELQEDYIKQNNEYIRILQYSQQQDKKIRLLVDEYQTKLEKLNKNLEFLKQYCESTAPSIIYKLAQQEEIQITINNLIDLMK